MQAARCCNKGLHCMARTCDWMQSFIFLNILLYSICAFLLTDLKPKDVYEFVLWRCYSIILHPSKNAAIQDKDTFLNPFSEKAQVLFDIRKCRTAWDIDGSRL